MDIREIELPNSGFNMDLPNLGLEHRVPQPGLEHRVPEPGFLNIEFPNPEFEHRVSEPRVRTQSFESEFKKFESRVQLEFQCYVVMFPRFRPPRSSEPWVRNILKTCAPKKDEKKHPTEILWRPIGHEHFLRARKCNAKPLKN